METSISRKDILVSICIFTYNNEKYIIDAVESVLNQKTEYQIEILIFDDCSRDMTVQLLKKQYGDRFTIYTNTENKGYCFNLHKSLSVVKGKYFYSLAGDDCLANDYVVEKWIDYLENNQDIISATGWNKIINAGNEIIGEHKNYNTFYTFNEYLAGNPPMCYEGFIRTFWKESGESADFLLKGAKNNEEIPFWTFVMQKGKKAILHDYVFTYRYVKEEGRTNYNSITSPLQGFRDNYVNIKMMEKETTFYYRFMMFVRTYHEIVNSVIERHFWRIICLVSSLKFRDFLFCIMMTPIYYISKNKIPNREKEKIERCIIYADKKNSI